MDISHIDYFIFDLDETLYPAGHFMNKEEFYDSLHAFAAEQNGISIEEAAALTQKFKDDAGGQTDIIAAWKNHGNFDIHAYFDIIDAFEITRMKPCAITRHALEALPGQKIVFTNAHTSHAERILEYLELQHHVDFTSDYISRGFRIKPDPDIYVELIEDQGIDPKRAAMFEDREINLKPAHDLGMTTVLLHPEGNGYKPPSYVDHVFTDFISWVKSVGYMPEE